MEGETAKTRFKPRYRKQRKKIDAKGGEVPRIRQTHKTLGKVLEKREEEGVDAMVLGVGRKNDTSAGAVTPAGRCGKKKGGTFKRDWVVVDE